MEKVGKALQKLPRSQAEASVKLREKLFGVVRDLQLYNAEFLPKIMLYKIEPSSDDHHYDSMEVNELVEVDEGTRQLETFQDLEMEAETESDDFGFSIDNQSENGIEEVNETKPETDDNGNWYSLDCDQQQVQSKRKHSDLNDFHEEDLSVPMSDDDDDPDEVGGGDNHISEEDEDESEVESEEEIKRKYSNRKQKRQIQTPPDLFVIKRMRPFKKSVVSRIISTKGVTFLSPSKRPILMEPFKQNPMKFDSKTDTISVGEIPIILDEKGKSLECSRCFLKFKSNNKKDPAVEFQIHEHILGHHLDSLKCYICNKGVTTFGGLTIHVRGHQEQVFCDICGRPFAEKRKMVRHMITHMNASERAEATARGEGKTFEGYLCALKKRDRFSNEVVTTVKNIIDNEEMSEWKRKLICRVIRGNAKQIKDNQDNPLGKFPMIYDQQTDKLWVSGIEVIINETEVVLECSSCTTKLQGKGKNALVGVEIQMHNHIVSKHFDAFRCPFPNEECSSRTKRFENLTAYNQHLKTFHSRVPAVCEICGKIFKSSALLIPHRRKMHEDEKRPRSKSKLRRPLKHQCATCGKRCSESQNLKRHELTHLTPQKRENVVCSRCGKQFASSLHLTRHQKVTCLEKGQEKPRVPCCFCSRTLKTVQLLQKHIRKLHPNEDCGEERPFQCSRCPQRFMTEWNLDQHDKFKHAGSKDDDAQGKSKVDNETGTSSEGGFRCMRGCGKVVGTEHGRKVHEGYCDGQGCKTEKERANSKLKMRKQEKC